MSIWTTIFDLVKSNWKTIAITFTISKYLFNSYLIYRQNRYIQNHDVSNLSRKTRDKYSTLESLSGLAMDASTFNLIKDVAVLMFNVYELVWAVSGKLLKSLFITSHSDVAQTLVFAGISNILSFFWTLPISANAQLIKDNYQIANLIPWIIYKLVQLVLKMSTDSVELFVVLVVNRYLEHSRLWPIALTITMISVLKTIMVPAFLNFTGGLNPLDAETTQKFEPVCRNLQFQVDKIKVITDRSSNAQSYVVGLPSNGLVVLKSVMLDKFSHSELIGFLTQSIGQLKLYQDLIKSFLLGAKMLFYLYMFTMCLNSGTLYQDFGFQNEKPIFIGYLIFEKLVIPISISFEFISKKVSRLTVLHADNYAVSHGYESNLIDALKKFEETNLPSGGDWLFKAYYKAYPDINERLKAIESTKEESN